MRLVPPLLLLPIMCAYTAMSQSTSTPILIHPEEGACTPAQGNCYVTITFQGGSVNQHENWYTNFISHSKQGNLTISIDEQLETGSVSDTKASDPVAMSKNGSDLNISYQGPIVDSAPMTFTSISFKVQINQTAHDDLGDMLTQLSKVSATTVPISAATSNYVTVGKQLADFLFNAQLLQGRATGSFSFTPNAAPAPGVYAILAAQDSSVWQPFVDGLAQVPGGGLTSKKGPVTGITYYTYDVKYSQHIYPNLDAALGHIKSKPWANLYFAALTSAQSGWTLDQHTTVEDSFRKQMDDAQTLLAIDPDLTAEEKLTIGQEASDAINAAYQKRYIALVKAASPPPVPPGGVPAAQVITVGGQTVPVNPTVLSVGHDATENITRVMKNVQMGVAAAP